MRNTLDGVSLDAGSGVLARIESDAMSAFAVLDMDSFIKSAVELQEPTHFAAAGNSDVRKWFHPAARTLEPAAIDDGNFMMPGRTIVACRLDAVARESVRRYLQKAWRLGRGASLWHWSLYTDELELVGCHDWGADPVYIHGKLGEWAHDLCTVGVLSAYR